MEFIFYIFFASIGAAVGSFTGVLIDRLPRHENILFARSHCEKCGKLLSPIEMLPVISFIFLGGKCSNCSAPIPFRLFTIEIIMAVSYLLLFWQLTLGNISLFEFIFLMIIAPALAAIFFIDLIYGIIPDQLLTVIVIAASIFFLFENQGQLINHVISGFSSGGLFYALFFLTGGRGMGFGDVKLALVLGFLLGAPLIIVALYCAFLTGAIVAIILVIWGKKKLRGSTIPFGPFLVASGIISYFFGNELLSMFLNLF